MSHLVYFFSNFGGLTRRRRGAWPGKYFFDDHVLNENLGKVTKSCYHTITSVDMPEQNVVLWVIFTPPPPV